MMNTEEKKGRKREYFIIYSLVFFLVFICCYFPYFVKGKTFIWDKDGWKQHYKALVYYGEYIRSIIKQLFIKHEFTIPTWEFNLGEGSDIIQTLHYYVLGDPFTVFSFLVPPELMHHYYNAIVALRMYSMGLAFSILCFQFRIKDRFGVLAGSITYTFCYYTFYVSTRHPFFLNPMIYMPLLIVGIERVLDDQTPMLFSVIVFISCVSNLYFLYQLAIFSVIFTVIKSIQLLNKLDVKELIKRLLKLAVFAIVGAMMAGVILLPACYTFLSDPRRKIEFPFHWLYPLEYYLRIPEKLVTWYPMNKNDYWLCMGYGAPVLLGIFSLFYNTKERRTLKIIWVIGLVFVLLPFFGRAFSGFSYMNNRWSWALALTNSYILAEEWNVLCNPERKRKIVLFSCLVIFCAILFFLRGTWSLQLNCVVMFHLLFLVIATISDKTSVLNVISRKKQLLLLGVLIVSCYSLSFWKNTAKDNNPVNQAIASENIYSKLMSNETKAVKQVAEEENVKEFYRYTGRELEKNAGVLAGISGTQYYWSNSNGNIARFRDAMELRNADVFDYTGYEERAGLLTLSSVLYYAVPHRDDASISVPFGFSFVENFIVDQQNTAELYDLESIADEGATPLNEELRNGEKGIKEYSIYRNDNYLPLSYAYDSVLEEEIWNDLNPIEKEEAMLQAAVIRDYHGAVEKKELDYSCTKLDYSMTAEGDGVVIEDNAFIVTKANSSVVIDVGGLSNSENYFMIRGLDYDSFCEYDLYFGNESIGLRSIYSKEQWESLSEIEQQKLIECRKRAKAPLQASIDVKPSYGPKKNLTYYTDEYEWHSNRHDYVVNLGYNDEFMTDVRITFHNAGKYTFNSIEVFSLPMDSFADRAYSLYENGLCDVKMGSNKVEGSIQVEKSMLLCFSIPYSKGWTAKIDGIPTELYQTNIKNLGVEVKAGNHVICIEYHTPLLREGWILSVLGFISFVLSSLHKKRSNHMTA